MAKEITKTITEFETSDGKVFATKQAATEHEQKLEYKASETAANTEVREYVSKLLIQVKKVNTGSFNELNDLETSLEEFLEITDPNEDSDDYESSDDYYDSGCSW